MFSGRRTRPAALSADDIMVRMVNCGTSIAIYCVSFAEKEASDLSFLSKTFGKGARGSRPQTRFLMSAKKHNFTRNSLFSNGGYPFLKAGIPPKFGFHLSSYFHFLEHASPEIDT